MSNCLLDNAIYLDDVDKSQFKNYIGNGYRNVFYTTDENRNGRIILFGFDKGGNATTFILPWSSHVKYVVKFPTKEQDIYDHYVNTKYFKNTFERKKWVDNFEADKIVECLRPEQEVLHFLFDDDVLTEGFNTQPLRIHYFDIETEISDQFERPRDARNRINMMTIYDSKTEKFYTWSLQHAEIDFKEDPLKDYPKEKFVFFEFNDDEEALLEHFLDWQQDNYADVNFGWNTRAYDLPYLVRRIENVLGKGAAQRLSPVNRYFIKEVKELNQSPGTEPDIEVSVEGLFIADGLVLYRDKFGLGRPDGGFALDNIGEAEGCGHKIKYEGTLKDLYLKDYQRFYEYNVRDVDLVMRIEKKTKMINLSRTIPSFGLSQYSTVYSSISYLIGSVISFAKTEMNRVMCSYVGEKKHFEGFEGAFVFPAQVGVYRGGTGTCDFASLYPSNIRSINASPETYRGKVLIHRKGPDGVPLPVNEKNELAFDIFDDKVAKADDIIGYSIKYPNGKRAKVDLDKLRDWILKHGIYTANNTIFLKHEEKWGVIAKWCEYFYNQRKATKKKMAPIIHEIHNNSAKYSKDELAKMEEQAENLNARQGAFKNMINSIYGQMGSAFSPIANIDVAQSITRQGRMCNIASAHYVLEWMQKNYDPNFNGYLISPVDENHPDYKKVKKLAVIAVSGDTDSVFMDLTPVSASMIKKYNLPKMIRDWPAEKKKELWDTMTKFVDGELNQFVRDLVHNYCKTNQQNVLTYEFEYMNAMLIMEGKKHYLGHTIYCDGDACDKFKCTGLSIKRNESDITIKNCIKECYEGVIKHDWTERDYNNYITDLYDKFKNLDIDRISFWKGYGTAREATGFLTMQKGATIISRAATYYNQIIEKMGIGKKYDELRVGDKCRFCHIKTTNKYGIDCIAYKPGQWPHEFNELFQIDYSVMFEKTITDQLKRYREACGFSNCDPRKQVVQDVFEL